MSIISKQIFLKEIETSLSDKLTVTQLQSVIDTLTNCLGIYEMERNEENGSEAEFEDMVSVYIDAKRIAGRSAKTLERYKYQLKKFRAVCKTPVRKITVFDLRSYLTKEKDRGMSDSTIEGTREILSSFFGWLTREGLLEHDPSANLSTVKCKKEVKLPFTDVDIERLKEQCKTTRDKTLICFLLSTGCRISEVCGINRADIDLNNRECTVLGKGNKERKVYIDDITAMLIERYLNERVDTNEALFVGKGNKRLLPGGVRVMLHNIGDAAGVENVHPHRFRRTLATNLINRGMPIQEVATVLGHDKVDTTMRYIYISDDKVKNSYRKCA